MTDVELVELTLIATLDPTDAESGAELLAELDAIDFPDGYPSAISNLDSLDAASVETAMFLRTDASPDGSESFDVEDHDPNTLTVQYEDGTIVFGFVATEEAVGDFASVIETIRASAGTALRVPLFRFDYRLGTLVDPTADGIRGHPVLPADADVDFHLDHTEETTRVTIEGSADTPFEQFDALLPGLVEQYHDIARHFTEFEL